MQERTILLLIDKLGDAQATNDSVAHVNTSDAISHLTKRWKIVCAFVVYFAETKLFRRHPAKDIVRITVNTHT